MATQKEKEFQFSQIISKHFLAHDYTTEKKKDVISSCYRFFNKWNKKGYVVDEIRLVLYAFSIWGKCKESGNSYNTQTLYQRLNVEKGLFLKKHLVD
jgi:hypothetical protein